MILKPLACQFPPGSPTDPEHPEAIGHLHVTMSIATLPSILEHAATWRCSAPHAAMLKPDICMSVAPGAPLEGLMQARAIAAVGEWVRQKVQKARGPEASRPMPVRVRRMCRFRCVLHVGSAWCPLGWVSMSALSCMCVGLPYFLMEDSRQATNTPNRPQWAFPPTSAGFKIPLYRGTEAHSVVCSFIHTFQHRWDRDVTTTPQPTPSRYKPLVLGGAGLA